MSLCLCRAVLAYALHPRVDQGQDSRAWRRLHPFKASLRVLRLKEEEEEVARHESLSR